ncbi:hypothetical protein [Halarchaeum sp. P4]|uniref:hypothetical protein n=1 Tax=Halarchaeum sp. P4 TaxID=3421639 RepID=UPI003EBA0780
MPHNEAEDSTPGRTTSEEYIHRAKGRSLTGVAKQGVGAWLFALSSSVIAGIQALTDLLLFPVIAISNIGDAVIDALILKPLTIVISGSEASAASVAEFELFGLPLGTAILLVTFAMIGWYLRRPSTSDFLPGTFWDSPFTGVEEEDAGGEG